MKDYQYVLFDLDGTLTDPQVGITKSVAYALHKFDIEVENLNDLNKFIGPPLSNSFMEFYGFSEADAQTAIEKYREYFSVTGIFENTVYPYIPEMLAALQEKKTLIVATSKPAVFADKILEHFHLRSYFAFVAGSELDGRRNSKSEVIQYALEQNHITDISSVVMVGDRKHDIIGAKLQNIDSIGVLFGYGDEKELTEAGATQIAATVQELWHVLDNNSLK